MNPTENRTGRSMPRYQSHKKVYALQIQTVERGETLLFTDPSYGPITPDPAIFARYKPLPGDYYVVYDDGYASISPRKAFEEGYTKL